MDLEAFDQAESTLKEALGKKVPNDKQLQAELAICYRKMGSSFSGKKRHADAADAYKRSLEAGGDGESPELLSDYLRALLVSGRAKEVQAEAARFGTCDPNPRESTKVDKAWESVTWVFAPSPPFSRMRTPLTTCSRRKRLRPRSISSGTGT